MEDEEDKLIDLRPVQHIDNAQNNKPCRQCRRRCEENSEGSGTVHRHTVTAEQCTDNRHH